MFFTQPSLLFILGLAFSFPKKSQRFREKIGLHFVTEVAPAQLNPHNKNPVIWNALSQSPSFPFRWTRVTRALGTRLICISLRLRSEVRKKALLEIRSHVAAPVRVFSIGWENKRTNNTNKDPSLDNNAAATSRRPMALEACESCYTTGKYSDKTKYEAIKSEVNKQELFYRYSTFN